jgi:CHASE3 domain sensor protein
MSDWDFGYIAAKKESDAEIERLRDALKQNADAQEVFQKIVKSQRELITELADWIAAHHAPYESMARYPTNLLQRARQASKHE